MATQTMTVGEKIASEFNLDKVALTDAEQRRLASMIDAQAGSPIPVHAICYFLDGNKWCCVFGDFVNLQESPAGFGDTQDAALAELTAQIVTSPRSAPRPSDIPPTVRAEQP